MTGACGAVKGIMRACKWGDEGVLCVTDSCGEGS